MKTRRHGRHPRCNQVAQARPAIEIAKLMGARVIACASSPDKLDICRALGADEGLNYDEGDLKENLRALTGGRGVDVVYDCVGDKYADPAVSRPRVGRPVSDCGLCGG